MKITGMISVTFQGINGAGDITVPGIEVGDIVVTVVESTGQAGDFASIFNAVVTAANTIHKYTSTDYSTKEFLAVILRQ